MIVIGDVHGMLEELKSLLSVLSPVPGELIVYVGDLVDKGPDSAGTVAFAREHENPKILVRGNHEWKHERFRKKWFSGDKTAMDMRGAEEIRDITEQLSPADVLFLESAVGYHSIGKYLVVHGGVPGDMASLPPSPSMRGVSNKGWAPYEKLMMTRHISRETGKMVSLGKHEAGDPYWADTYEGRFGKVLFGHEPQMTGGPAIFPHAICLDSGAVYGGGLTALRIGAEGTETLVTVPSRTFRQRKLDFSE